LTSLTVVGGMNSIDVAQGATTTGVQNYTGRIVANGVLDGSAIIINGVLQVDADATVVLLTDAVELNGGASTVTGTGSLTILPVTSGIAIDVGGTAGGMNLSGEA